MATSVAISALCVLVLSVSVFFHNRASVCSGYGSGSTLLFAEWTNGCQVYMVIQTLQHDLCKLIEMMGFFTYVDFLAKSCM